jgi:hypothetical protein
MKNIKTSVELFEKKEDRNFTEDEYKAFSKLVRNEHFEEAFEYAEKNGIFGGNFSEWLESRKRQNSANSEMYKAVTSYQDACKKLAKFIIADLPAGAFDTP